MKMRCPRVLQLIDDHVDGLLPAREAEDVRDHLDQCRDCRDTAVAAKAASTSLAVWGDLDPPAACFDQILSKIDALPADALRRPAHRPVRAAPVRLLRWAGPSLAAAAAVVAAFVWSERSAEPVAHPRVVGPVAASTLARPLAQGNTVLLPGEEYIRLDERAWDRGVRRTRRIDPLQPALGGGAQLIPAIFSTPR